MKKQVYTKPTMLVAKIQQQIICTSPTGYGGQSLKMQNGTINKEEDVW